jgi:hypothetical protein
MQIEAVASLCPVGRDWEHSLELGDAVDLRFEFVGGYCRPPNRSRGLKSRSMRATTSSWLITSPRLDAAMPRSTPAMNSAWRFSMLVTVCSPTCAAFLPSLALPSRASAD